MEHYKDGSSEYTRNYLSLSDSETPEILITQSQSQNIISILHIFLEDDEARWSVFMYLLTIALLRGRLQLNIRDFGQREDS